MRQLSMRNTILKVMVNDNLTPKLFVFTCMEPTLNSNFFELNI